MTQDDVIRTSPPICALDFGVPAEFAERAESYARWAVAQEREKRTGIQEFVTLPREVVDQVRGALAYVGVGNASENPNLAQSTCRQAIWKLDHALRAALEQSQNHVPDAGNMVPAGWKLVPVEPNCSMVLAGERSLGQHDFLRLDSAYRAMLDAAPKPPTVKESLTVEQPQANQPAMTPIAQRKLEDLMASGYTISGYSVYHEQKHQHGFVTGAGLVGWWKPDGMEYPQPQGEREPVAIPCECPHIIWFDDSDMRPMMFAGNGARDAALKAFERVSVQWNAHLFIRIQKNSRDDQYPCAQLYTHPQPKREPLTDAQAKALLAELTGRDPACANDYNWDYELRIIRAIEAAHNIK